MATEYDSSACWAREYQRNKGAEDLKEQLQRRKDLPVLWPIEDREDAAHNIIVRLLPLANSRGIDVATLAQGDPDAVTHAIEAERSNVRRARGKLGRQMSEEMVQAIPGGPNPTPDESEGIIRKAAQAAVLTAKETRLIHLNFTRGICNTDELARLMNITKDEVYRVRSEAKRKLLAIPALLKPLLENHVHPAQPSPDNGGTWRPFSGHVL